MLKRLNWLCAMLFLCLMGTGVAMAQRPVFSLGEGPWYYQTYEQGMNIQVSVVTRGLFHPWSIAFLPGFSTAGNAVGEALITEKEGRVRLLRNGRLQTEPVADLSALELAVLFDILLHPQFAENGYVYITYMKQGARPDGEDGYWATTAVARGVWNGDRITDMQEIFAAEEGWRDSRGGDAIGAVFAPDGKLLITSSHRLDPDAPQALDSHIGKILRLNDDGSVPLDNPFIGREGVQREIFSVGHRTVMGLTVHPQTGAIWEAENGPQGGDEVNILIPGENYGWPIVTYGREYDGRRASERPWRDEFRQPELFWVPSITLASLTFYSGDKLPAWKDNLFVASMTTGRLPGTGHIERIVFNENGELRREELLNDLRQRIRHIQEGPDGFLYLLTDENDGVLLKIEAIDEIPDNVSGNNTTSTAETASGGLFPDFDCSVCHQVDRNTVGPSYQAIAAEYSSTPANIDLLARKIIDGGEGNWGDVPMAAHSNIGMEKAREMVRLILAQ